MDQWFKRENPMPCPPDMSELNNMLQDFDSEEQAEEIERAKEAIDCLETTLLLYNIFTMTPNENVIKEMYNRTKELLNESYNSRRIQEDNVREQYRDLEEQFYDYECDQYIGIPESGEVFIPVSTDLPPYCNEIIDRMDFARSTLQQFKRDYEQLDALKEICQHGSSRQEKVLCVESFIHAAHTRGPYLPTGCGFTLPEEIIPQDYEYLPFEELGPIAEEITENTLDCLAGE